MGNGEEDYWKSWGGDEQGGAAWFRELRRRSPNHFRCRSQRKSQCSPLIWEPTRGQGGPWGPLRTEEASRRVRFPVFGHFRTCWNSESGCSFT